MSEEYAAYRGNHNLKRANAQVQFTPEQIQEYVKCANDPIYFIKKYVKIIHVDKGLVPFSLWDFQEEMIDMMIRDRFTIYCMPRQIGKTTCSAAAMIHYAIFNEDKTIAILANKADQAREILHRIQLMFEHVPHWMKPGIIEWNKGSVEFDNGSRILTSATSGSGIRGKSVSWLYCVAGKTHIKVKNKKTGEIRDVEIGEFADMLNKRKQTLQGNLECSVPIHTESDGQDKIYITMD